MASMAKQKAVPAGKQRVIAETGIYRKFNGKYLAQFRDPGRKQRWKEFRTTRRACGHRRSLVGLAAGRCPHARLMLRAADAEEKIRASVQRARSRESSPDVAHVGPRSKSFRACGAAGCVPRPQADAPSLGLRPRVVCARTPRAPCRGHRSLRRDVQAFVRASNVEQALAHDLRTLARAEAPREHARSNRALPPPARSRRRPMLDSIDGRVEPPHPD